MPKHVQVSPVPPEEYFEALRFVAAGASRDELADVRCAVLEKIVSARGSDAAQLWWGRRGRRCVAAAIVVPSPGRVGMLFACRPDAAGVETPVLMQVVRAVSLAALVSGRAFVQSLVEPDAGGEIAVLTGAGFECLAELIYIRLDLARLPAPSGQSALVWRRCGEFDEDELGRVIDDTYRDSLDCPGLAGIRSMPDVIAAHKVSGQFSPDSWWIVHLPAEPGRQSAAAGCILINDAGLQAADLVYMGVVPACRGRGLGEAMVRGAADRVRQRGIRTLTAAVDAGNVRARRIYDRLGFVGTHRRLAYMLVPPAKGS
jgi:ribosomal protein S18 acetylase RimI-like enzyme